MKITKPGMCFKRKQSSSCLLKFTYPRKQTLSWLEKQGKERRPENKGTSICKEMHLCRINTMSGRSKIKRPKLNGNRHKTSRI